MVGNVKCINEAGQTGEGCTKEEGDVRGGGDQSAGVPVGYAQKMPEQEWRHVGGRRLVQQGGDQRGPEPDSSYDSSEIFVDAIDSMPVETYHDVSFDKSEYEDFHDTLDLTAGEDSSRPLAASEYKGVSKNEVVPEYERMVRNKAIPEYERVAKNVDVNKYEYEILEPDASDAEDYIQDEPFVPEEVYYTKAMNPKALGATEEMKARARAGIRKRRRMNEPTYKKIKRSIASLATVFAACTVAAASFSREAVTSPFDGSFDELQPFVSWMSGQPRREVDCYELFAGKARISEAFAKRGRGVLQPRDIVFAHDLRDKAVQEEVLHDIRSYRPGLLWVAPPCTL